MNLLHAHGGRVSSTFESDALFVAAASGNIKHLSLLADAGADLTMANYDKVGQHQATYLVFGLF